MTELDRSTLAPPPDDAERRLEAAERTLDVQLLPWQRRIALAALRGERFVWVGGRRVGRLTTQRVVNAAAERPAPPQSPTSKAASVAERLIEWHDEGQRFERTGRLDEGPCWCDDCVAAELASNPDVEGSEP